MSLLVLLRQLVLRTEHIVRELNTRASPLPFNHPVLDHELPVQNRIEKLPVIALRFQQLWIRAKRTRRRSLLDHLITLFAQNILFLHTQRLARLRIHIQQLIVIHIADIHIPGILIHHPPEIIQLLFLQSYRLFLLVKQSGDIGQDNLKKRTPLFLIHHHRCRKPDPHLPLTSFRQAYRQYETRTGLFPDARQFAFD